MIRGRILKILLLFLCNNFTNTLKNNDLAVIIIAIIFLFLKGIIWIEMN